jgi:Domain of Unknown Function (DUF928)
VPYELTANTPLQFVVQDEADNFVYRSRITPKTQAGLIQVAIPTTNPGLVQGTRYSWTFSIQCDPSQPSNTVYVQGTVQRIALDPKLQKQLTTASPLERVRLYAASGIWHDAFNLSADLHRSSPNNPQITETWSSLLRQTSLETFVAKPFADCCKKQP